MQAETSPPVTPEMRVAFERDGVVFLPGLFDAAWVAYMRDAVEAAMAAPGPLSDNFSPSPDKGKFYGEHFLWPRHAAFRRDRPARHGCGREGSRKAASGPWRRSCRGDG